MISLWGIIYFHRCENLKRRRRVSYLNSHAAQNNKSDQIFLAAAAAEFQFNILKISLPYANSHAAAASRQRFIVQICEGYLISHAAQIPI